MIKFSMFITQYDKNYDCYFLPDEKIALAVGPLPGRAGARGVAFKVKAES